MSEDKWTSIRVKKSTAQKLSDIGRKGESYDDLIVWLLENSKKRKASYKPEKEEQSVTK
jgi:hypothetical protein